MQHALGFAAFIADLAKRIFQNTAKYALYPLQFIMHEPKPSELKNRLLYGAIIGAIVGMIIGTMPTNDPRVALLSMGFSAVVISALAGISDSFWDSLRAAWELVRISFWRW